MKTIFSIFFILVILSCKPPQRQITSIASYDTLRPVKLTIKLILNVPDYSYQFRFINNSSEIIRIVKPELDQGFSKFFKLYSDSIISQERCATYHIQKISFLELPPGKEVIDSSGFNLKTYFCQIREGELIGYFYSGSYILKSGSQRPFGFEILPIPIHRSDTITIHKLLF